MILVHFRLLQFPVKCETIEDAKTVLRSLQSTYQECEGFIEEEDGEVWKLAEQAK